MASGRKQPHAYPSVPRLQISTLKVAQGLLCDQWIERAGRRQLVEHCPPSKGEPGARLGSHGSRPRIPCPSTWEPSRTGRMSVVHQQLMSYRRFSEIKKESFPKRSARSKCRVVSGRALLVPCSSRAAGDKPAGDLPRSSQPRSPRGAQIGMPSTEAALTRDWVTAARLPAEPTRMCPGPRSECMRTPARCRRGRASTGELWGCERARSRRSTTTRLSCETSRRCFWDLAFLVGDRPAVARRDACARVGCSAAHRGPNVRGFHDSSCRATVRYLKMSDNGHSRCSDDCR